MRRGIAAALLAPALAAIAAVVPAAVAAAADPAREALAARDAYVSPRVLGPAAAEEEHELAGVAARMDAAGRPVKLAVVLGPAGAPSLRVYARRLAGDLAFGGTLVVTTPAGAVAAAGPRPAADITRDLRAARVGAAADPVDRLARAADAAAPPPVDPAEVGTRTILLLVGVALLGGLWALAIGSGRGERRTRREVAEARARVRVCLDALRARATALMRREDLPAPARAGVGRALNTYAEAVTSLQEMRVARQVDALAPEVHAGMDEIARAAESVGESMPSDDPFAGLCAVDPAHGPCAPGTAMCEDCDEAIGRGEPPLPRMLAVDGQPVPFDAVAYGPLLRPVEAAGAGAPGSP